MFPSVLPEPFIHRFKFWSEGAVQEGMYTKNELYRLIATFPVESREKAYRLAVDLSQHGQSIIISCSEQHYTVWSSLRTEHRNSPTSQTFSQREARPRSLPALVSNPEHPALGRWYILGSTNHPQATAYQGEVCQIKEVWQRGNNLLMVSVQLRDGTQLRGLFLHELEDADGLNVSQRSFQKPALTSSHKHF